MYMSTKKIHKDKINNVTLVNVMNWSNHSM